MTIRRDLSHGTPKVGACGNCGCDLISGQTYIVHGSGRLCHRCGPFIVPLVKGGAGANVGGLCVILAAVIVCGLFWWWVFA